jgi:hypothetical protein
LSELLISLSEEFLSNAETPVETALKVAQASAEISKMKQGLEKMLREDGITTKQQRMEN